MCFFAVKRLHSWADVWFKRCLSFLELKIFHVKEIQLEQMLQLKIKKKLAVSWGLTHLLVKSYRIRVNYVTFVSLVT